MKMSGIVKKYDDITLTGYIEGYDGITYLYHQRNVENDAILKEGDLVKFNFDIVENDYCANDIEKK